MLVLQNNQYLSDGLWAMRGSKRRNTGVGLSQVHPLTPGARIVFLIDGLRSLGVIAMDFRARLSMGSLESVSVIEKYPEVPCDEGDSTSQMVPALPNHVGEVLGVLL